MAKAGLLFVGTEDGIVLFSNPGAIGRWLKIGQELRGRAIRAIWPAVDNPLVVFAAAQGMGLQRSDDGGQSWRQTLDADVYTIVGHQSAANVLYLGASDGLVYRSEDSGASWESVGPAERPAGDGVARVIGAHDDSRRLYLGLGGNVWAGADGGRQWTRYSTELPGAVAALAVWPAQPDVLYAIAAGVLFRGAGAAERWERIDTARPDAGAAFAILAGKEPVLLMALADGAGLGRSADEGATWAPVESEAPWSGRVTALVPARYHIDTAFAGSGGGQIALSSDRGRAWQILRQDLAPVRSIAAARLA